MSVRVLVIPEDPTNNGYILQPIAEALLADAGKPRAKVHVLTNPRLTGYDHAVRAIRGDLKDRYGFWALWLFFPDADRATSGAMDALEQELDAQRVKLLCCPAQPEVEIYACVSRKDRLGVSWDDARAHPRFKEQIFDPFLVREGDAREAGAGRKTLTQESVRNLQLLYSLCPELKQLRDRIEAALTS